MTNLDKLDRVLLEIKTTLLNNENIRKLLKYNTPDALSLSAPTKEQVNYAIKTDPTIYMEEDQNKIELNSFIVAYVPSLNFSSDFNDITFMIDLFTKKEILNLHNNQIRLLQLLSEVSKSIDNKRVSLAGRIHLTNASYIVVGTRYVGYQIEFSVIDEAIENDF